MLNFLTIQEWNLVASVIPTALLLVGGFWLRNLVNQQLKAKDATIESRDATIKLHEAEIASLKAVSVPALVAEHKGAFEHAEHMTAQKQRLEERVLELKEMIAKNTASEEEDAKLLPFETNVAETAGIIEIWHMFQDSVIRYMPVTYKDPSGDLFAGLIGKIHAFESKFETRIDIGFRRFAELRAANESQNSNQLNS
jgi:hypothetical protein